MNVPVGPTTKAGWGAAATAFVGAVLVYLTGDHTAKEVTAVELAGGSFVLFAITHGFRYLQSLLHIKTLLPTLPDLPASAPEAPGPEELPETE